MSGGARDDGKYVDVTVMVTCDSGVAEKVSVSLIIAAKEDVGVDVDSGLAVTVGGSEVLVEVE